MGREQDARKGNKWRIYCRGPHVQRHPARAVRLPPHRAQPLRPPSSSSSIRSTARRLAGIRRALTHCACFVDRSLSAAPTARPSPWATEHRNTGLVRQIGPLQIGLHCGRFEESGATSCIHWRSGSGKLKRGAMRNGAMAGHNIQSEYVRSAPVCPL
jgi:hypothetical protein